MNRIIATFSLLSLFSPLLSAYEETPLADQPIFTVSGVPSNVALALSVEYPTAEVLAYYGETYSPDAEYVGYWNPDKCYDYVDGMGDVFDGDSKLFNTGVNDSGELLAEFTSDPHWRVTQAVNSQDKEKLSRVSESVYAVHDSDTAKYLGFTSAGNVSTGAYVYESDTFVFATDVDPQDVSVAFGLFADDSLVKLRINGVETSVTSTAGWNYRQWVRIPAGSFTETSNKISLEIRNTGGPTGILIDDMRV